MTKHISLCIIIVYIDIYTCLYTYMYIIIDVNHVSCYYTTLHSHASYNFMKLSCVAESATPLHVACGVGMHGRCGGSLQWEVLALIHTLHGTVYGWLKLQLCTVCVNSGASTKADQFVCLGLIFWQDMKHMQQHMLYSCSVQ